jgi:hypothetical protein
VDATRAVANMSEAADFKAAFGWIAMAANANR